MGNKNTSARRATGEDKQSAWLVVLHKAGQEIENIKYLLDALNASPPVGDVDVDYDFKPVAIQDDGNLSEDINIDIKNCLENNRIVFICFLANGKTKGLWEQIENDEKVIMCRYRKPDIEGPLPQKIIMVDADLNTAGPDEMTAAVPELAKIILTKSNQ